MTKRKPDKVIEYRFSPQDKEREILDQFVNAHTFNSISTPVVNLMNDVTGMTVFLTLVASVLGFTFITTNLTAPSSADVIDAFLTQRQQALAAGAIIGGTSFSIGTWISEQLGLFDQES